MDELKERDWEIRCWVLGNLYRPDTHLQEDMGVWNHEAVTGLSKTVALPFPI